MRVLSFFVLLLSSLTINAASISVAPFQMTMDVQEGYAITAEIELACRYEKIIFGDSAEFETFYQTPKKLKVKTKKIGGMQEVTLINDSKLYFEYDRLFKYGKECRASFTVNFTSEKYAVGMGMRPYRAVNFKLWKGFYDYQEGDQVYDLSKMEKFLHKTTYTFTQKNFDSMMHIRILQDGREAETNPWVETVHYNPATGKPYSPKN